MAQQIVETPPEYDNTRVIERPDGFYWQSAISGEEYGPFKTYADAVEDMEYVAEAEPDETLEEAEAEIGLSGWIDPDTGDFGDTWSPRIEDH